MKTVDLRLKSPSCIIVTGSSNSGKSHLIEQILFNHTECFEQPIEELVWVYSKYADDPNRFSRLTDSFNKQRIPISFIQDFPSQKIANNSLFTTSRDRHKCVIFDDVCQSPKNIPALFDIWNILSHHQNFTAILVVQNLAGSTPTEKSCLSTLLRSTTYIILFCNRRILPVIRSLANSYFPGECRRLTEPLRHMLTQKRPFSYLVIDFNTEEELLLVREGGLIPEHEAFGFIFHDETHKIESNTV